MHCHAEMPCVAGMAGWVGKGRARRDEASLKRHLTCARKSGPDGNGMDAGTAKQKHSSCSVQTCVIDNRQSCRVVQLNLTPEMEVF